MTTWLANVWLEDVWLDGVWLGMGGVAPPAVVVAQTSGSSGQYKPWFRRQAATFTAYTPPEMPGKTKRRRILNALVI